MNNRSLIFRLAVGALSLCTSGISIAECTYKAEEKGFGFSFTAYGAPEKAYAFKGNTFKKYSLKSESGALTGATIKIDTTSLDTSHDMNNGKGGEWPASLAGMRDSNLVNGFFKNFEKDGTEVTAKISSIGEDSVDLEVTMNGVTKTIPMKFKMKGDELLATGSLDVLDFNTNKAFESLRMMCESAFHQGKTWSDIDFEFHVPVEKSCS